VLAGLLALAYTPGDLAEAEVAVGDERARLEPAGPLEGLAIAVPGLLGDRWRGASSDVTKQAQHSALEQCPVGLTSSIESVQGDGGESLVTRLQLIVLRGSDANVLRLVAILNDTADPKHAGRTARRYGAERHLGVFARLRPFHGQSPQRWIL